MSLVPDGVKDVLSLIAWPFGGIFLALTLLRNTKGVTGAVAGAAQGVGKKANGFLSKARGNVAAQRHQQRMAGERDKGKLGNAYRRTVTGFTVPDSGAFKPWRSGRSQYRMTQERMTGAASEALLKRPGVNQALMDDDVRGVLAVGEDRAEAFLAAKGITKGSAKYDSVMGSAKSIGFSHASRLAALQGESTHGKGRNMKAIATTYAQADESGALAALTADIGHSSGMNNEGVDRLRQNTMYNFGANGRADLRQASVGAVLDNKYDTQLAATASDSAMERIAGEMTSRLTTGATTDERVTAAAQLLATQESISRMSEPTRKVFTDTMAASVGAGGAGVDYGSQSPIEIQLATQIAYADDPTTEAYVINTSMDVSSAQTNLETLRASGTATPAQLTQAQQRVDTARAAYAQAREPIERIARQIRGTSSTYSSGVPYGAREQP
ncbi:MAG TPA: hypothetical protein VLE99_00560 [Candidatus Saccharimonadales bacterium]|nr:hypothetical protein [Candidatus Saccharimonadales bacterium]